MDQNQRERIALFRFTVLGPLVSARLEHGERTELLEAAAKRTYQDPAGRLKSPAESTIERWYYRYRQDGLAGLEPQSRRDAGTSRSIPAETAATILAMKRERPRRSMRRIIRILERARRVKPGQLSKSSVHRLLEAHGISRRPSRYPEERRAFRHPFAGDLWQGDVMHGPMVPVNGTARRSYLHAFLDSATRFIVAAAFRLGETAVDHEAVLKQGILTYGVPRVLYLDQGPAQTALSLRRICADLGVHLRHCRPRDPAAKGALERFFKTVRAEILDELDPTALPVLGDLNANLWSWLSVDYHKRPHGGTKRVPLEHWLEQVEHLRPPPPATELDRIFLHRVKRRVRNDGTVRFDGRFLEVRAELAGQWIELRYDPQRTQRLPLVFRQGEFVCDTVELDPIANSRRPRRRIEPPLEPTPSSGIDPLALLRDEHERRRRPPGHATSAPTKSRKDQKE